jgi:glutamate-5-semialdehyde dehydrogenase
MMSPTGSKSVVSRVPIGVIGIVSELAPLETIDALALCLKSGNVCVFRGSPDWTLTQQTIAACLSKVAAGSRDPSPGPATIIERPEKEAALELIKSGKALDAIIPRGGRGAS